MSKVWIVPRLLRRCMCWAMQIVQLHFRYEDDEARFICRLGVAKYWDCPSFHDSMQCRQRIAKKRPGLKNSGGDALKQPVGEAEVQYGEDLEMLDYVNIISYIASYVFYVVNQVSTVVGY